MDHLVRGSKSFHDEVPTGMTSARLYEAKESGVEKGPRVRWRGACSRLPGSQCGWSIWPDEAGQDQGLMAPGLGMQGEF